LAATVEGSAVADFPLNVGGGKTKFRIKDHFVAAAANHFFTVAIC
jgi:hypothetical protein